MDTSLLSSEPHTALEGLVGRTIFASRWLLAPFYVGLAISLVVLLIKFGQKTVRLLSNALPSASTADVITNVLSLVDISLVASLVLMVMLACYENFVSGFELEGQKYKPSFMGHVDFGDLKVKLLTSIVAISAIHVLESFMNIGSASDRELVWSVGILMAFVVAGVLLAVMNRLSAAEHR
jgi:uncharacterized protein (TIGR00645 family)